jgi:hypothetical protein
MDKHTFEPVSGDERRSSTSFEELEEFENEVTRNIRVPPMIARGTMKRPAEPAPTPDELERVRRTSNSG